MLVSFEDIRGYGIRAVDGDIGTLSDVLFEDAASAIRYLVVETGGWLLGREVLLAPAALGRVEPETRTIATALTTGQVKDSPTLGGEQAISREHEELLHRHYDWVPYWQSTTAAGLAPQWGLLGLPPAPAYDDPIEREVAAAARERAEPLLRSAREVVGDDVAATDGDIGHVADLLIDDARWTIRHLVLATRNWLPGRKVLIGPGRLRSVDWAGRRILLDLSRREVETSPEYDPATGAASA
jgi:PRC-barrel domain